MINPMPSVSERVCDDAEEECSLSIEHTNVTFVSVTNLH